MMLPKTPGCSQRLSPPGPEAVPEPLDPVDLYARGTPSGADNGGGMQRYSSLQNCEPPGLDDCASGRGRRRATTEQCHRATTTRREAWMIAVGSRPKAASWNLSRQRDCLGEAVEANLQSATGSSDADAAIPGRRHVSEPSLRQLGAKEGGAREMEVGWGSLGDRAAGGRSQDADVDGSLFMKLVQSRLNQIQHSGEPLTLPCGERTGTQGCWSDAMPAKPDSHGSASGRSSAAAEQMETPLPATFSSECSKADVVPPANSEGQELPVVGKLPCSHAVQTLQGHLRLGRVLNQGANSMVYKALTPAGQLVAVKLTPSQGMSARVAKESALMQSLSHPNVAQMFGVMHDMCMVPCTPNPAAAAAPTSYTGGEVPSSQLPSSLPCSAVASKLHCACCAERDSLAGGPHPCCTCEERADQRHGCCSIFAHRSKREDAQQCASSDPALCLPHASARTALPADSANGRDAGSTVHLLAPAGSAPSGSIRYHAVVMPFYDCGTLLDQYARWRSRFPMLYACRRPSSCSDSAWLAAETPEPEFAPSSEGLPPPPLDDPEPQSLPPHLQEVLISLLEVAAAVDYLHSNGVLHLDLKPANIFVSSAPCDSRKFRTHVADFDLSHVLGSGCSHSEACPGADSSSLLERNCLTVPQLCGTHGYIAPELFEGLPPSKACDVYSFGIIMAEMLLCWPYSHVLEPGPLGMAQVLLGQRPCLPAWCPPRYAALAEACWAPEPACRPSFLQIQQELQQLLLQSCCQQDLDCLLS